MPREVGMRALLRRLHSCASAVQHGGWAALGWAHKGWGQEPRVPLPCLLPPPQEPPVLTLRGTGTVVVMSNGEVAMNE